MQLDKIMWKWTKFDPFISGETVVVFEYEEGTDSSVSDWFVADVLFVEGLASDQKAPSWFQVTDIDASMILFVNINRLEKVMM